MRFHCEFKTCKCCKFKLHYNNLCFYCGHANIWHSKKEKKTKQDCFAFESTRPNARIPKYEKQNISIGILIPISQELIEDNFIYCECIEMLPV